MCAPEGDLLAGSAAAIARVAPDRQTVVGKLHADLMASARKQADAHQRQLPRLAALLVAQFRVLRAGRIRGHDAHHVGFAILEQEVADLVRFLRVPADGGDILPMHGLIPHLRAQPVRRLAGFGQHDEAAHRPVQPMDKPQIHRAGLAVSLGDIRLHGAVQIRIAGIIRLRRHIRRLDDHEQMVILVNDGYAAIAFHFMPSASVRLRRRAGRRPPSRAGRLRPP